MTTYLSLDDDTLESPPPEIVNKGIEAIIQYLQQLEQEGVDYLFEAKLLIVGEGGAGKTTLANKIKDPNYALPNYHPSTEGIDIISWHFPLTDERDFQVNIWDFGGQEIYHTTHQFFLTKRSLYVLVIDNRKEHTDLSYWLNVVELLSDNSPLLIVQNEKDDRLVQLNLRELRGQFENLKENFATNLKTPGGMDDILQELKHHFNTLPHVGDQIPRTWLNVREALEVSDQNYISLTDYLRICADNGIDRDQDKMQLSGYLHDLGICLHFQEDILLKQTVILKPTWGTDAVYRVLDNRQVRENFGRFSWNDLTQIWADEKYVAKQAELLQLMTKFKLCYSLPNQPDWFIAPHLLTKVKPDYEWDKANNLLLQYSYDFMPKGIITRFIVMMHNSIEDQANVWQTGVVLTKKDTRAEVIEDYNQRKITIRVIGSHPRDFLSAIMFQLDNIHASFPRLKYNKLVPCNCSKCKDSQTPHFYKFEELQERLRKRKDTIECYNSYEDVWVRSLLDNIGEQIEDTNHPEAADIREIIKRKKNQLQKLKLQEAEIGMYTPPHILTQIEKLKHEIEEAQFELRNLLKFPS